MTETPNNDVGAKHQRSKNLVPPWKPGQSGNPKGPPKRRLHLWTRFCKFMEDMTWDQLQALNKDETKKGKMSLADLTALKWAVDAGKGKWNQLREAIERDEGKMPQTTNLESSTGAIIHITNSIMSDDEHKERMDAQARALSGEQEAGDSV